ncbi:MAG TPA: 2'-5' RNA ligase family protein [Caulobacteraceae bacterium]
MIAKPFERATDPLKHRLFFAVQPDELTGARLVRFTQDEGSRGRPIDRRRLHVTLGMVGRWADAPPQEAIELARQIADQIALRPFKVSFRHLQSWRESQGPLVLLGEEGEVVGLRRLHDALCEAYRMKPAPDFDPHISLIWSPDVWPARTISPFSWMVREFVLIHSVYGRSHHEVLGRWPLGEA